MIRSLQSGRALALGSSLLLAAAAAVAQAPAPAKTDHPATADSSAPQIEPKAAELLKAMGSRLAGARSFSFTAVATFEQPSAYGHVLQYSTKYEVTVQRPDKLRVIIVGDGPRSEFYYDGKTMAQLAPAENLLAVAEAPPTIDAMLQKAFETADIYFPFTDFLVADPHKDLGEGMQLAFHIGPSMVVDGTTTDMIAFESSGVFVQGWVGRDDKLPRRARAQFDADPLQLRHQVDMTAWKLEPPLTAETFVAPVSATTKRIEFARKEGSSALPPGSKPLSETLRQDGSKKSEPVKGTKP